MANFIVTLWVEIEADNIDDAFEAASHLPEVLTEFADCYEAGVNGVEEVE